jgi:NAD(P)H-dependent FMN reductase
MGQGKRKEVFEVHILILSGSRNRRGQTARAIDALARGVAAAGGSTEAVFLTVMKLERCRQCEKDGWGLCRDESRCIIEDDFAGIVEKLEAADLVVFATPVYFSDLSESMRAFLDRFRRIRFPQIMAARSHRPTPFTPPARLPAVGICCAGGSGNGTANCAANLERILQSCGLDLVDMILTRRQNIEAKLPLLEMTGRWLVAKPTSGPPVPPPMPGHIGKRESKKVK